MTNTRYLFLLSILLRVIVMLVFLPRITEEGAWTLRDALSDMLQRTRSSFINGITQVRISILRKRARRYEDRERNAEQKHDGEE